MLKGIANIASLMRQAQQMGGKVQAINDQLKNVRARGVGGGGLVEVEVNGVGEMLRLKIDPTLVERGEREMIEDLVPAAVNQALAKAKKLHAEAMQTLAKDLDVPGLNEAISQFTDGAGSGGP
jgi:DNA-binding YbaB/EbfC family protein